jgi:cytochrome oxidase Cu insertion factor (SCO1/SenC/PrrC family)
MTRVRVVPVLITLLGVVSLAGCAGPESAPQLGPKDGLDLPPTDLERVSVGEAAPDFTLEAYSGDTVTLSDFQGDKNVVLVFYRGHW